MTEHDIDKRIGEIIAKALLDMPEGPVSRESLIVAVSCAVRDGAIFGMELGKIANDIAWRNVMKEEGA